MIKNTIIALLIIACIAEGAYILKTHHTKEELTMQPQSKSLMAPTNRPKPSFIMKGQKFADNPLSSKAYLIFPTNGPLTGDAKTAMTGWNMQTTASADGSTVVTLIPHEAEDIKQSFTVKPGNKLYFIEMTLVDDTTGVDENRGDDIGVLVDQNGIVQ